MIPGLSQAGGFTITSTPQQAVPSSAKALGHDAFIELAIQKSRHPPAAWLWQPKARILHALLAVRVGGSFVWPPPGINVDEVKRVVLIAAGVGIKYESRPPVPQHATS